MNYLAIDKFRVYINEGYKAGNEKENKQLILCIKLSALEFLCSPLKSMKCHKIESS